MTASVAIVVPVRNEAGRIGSAVRRLLHDFPDCELVVVDGDSTDTTVPEALDAASGNASARVVSTAAGRARQLNHGAHLTRSDILWFVHADTTVAPDALPQIRAALADPQVVGGGLTLRFDRRSLGLRYVAATSNVRARRLHWVFGDQAMFVRRSVFDALGGFPDLSIMEDLEMSRRLAAKGRLVVLPATSTASARRFDEHGVWRMLVFMQWLKGMHFAGTDSDEIARRYAAGPRRQSRPSRLTLDREIVRAHSD